MSAGIIPGKHVNGKPQTPIDTSPRSASHASQTTKTLASRSVPPYLRWAVQPLSALNLLLLPIVLYVSWEIVLGYVAPGVQNPFACFFLLSGRISTSTPEDPRYAKTYLDLVFLAYSIVFFSLFRQLLVVKICRPVAKYFGLRKKAKIDRFGEQGYAMVYFSIFGAWGYRIMMQLPTNWYRTEYFFVNYPYWEMIPELKRYYLMQMAYWCQQFIVLVLCLEKPRTDHRELIVHHMVTLWLIGGSYLLNHTLMGHAVYMSMDIPDAFFALSKLLNYIQWNRLKIVSLVCFIFVWSYFRHYLNIKILWSVWFESSLVPEWSKTWNPANGVWMPSWMTYQMFLPLLLLQLLNLFWFYLIMRVVWRTITTGYTQDVRSDDEEDSEKEDKKN